MELLIAGVNHKSASVALRERLAFTPEQLPEALGSLRARVQPREAVILSTCNRTEVIAVQEQPQPAALLDWLADHHGLDRAMLAPVTQAPEAVQAAESAQQGAQLAPVAYAHAGEAAVRHAFRVASGLDSMVLGEPQILGQFKAAFAAAGRLGCLGPELRALCVQASRAAKRVRRETAIGEASLSVAATTAILAEQLFTRLADCRALIVGAGDTAALVATHLQSRRVRELVFANRSLERARALAARFAAEAHDLQSIPALLPNADLVVTSTSAQLPILGKGLVERAMKARRHKPILMVDLAVPRDIEPEVAALPDIYLYAIDDLQQIIQGSQRQRAAAAEEAEALLAEAVADYRPAGKVQAMGDALSRFRELHEAQRDAALQKALARLRKGDAPEAVVTALANQLANKFMHGPSAALRDALSRDDAGLLSAVERIYGGRHDRDE